MLKQKGCEFFLEFKRVSRGGGENRTKESFASDICGIGRFISKMTKGCGEDLKGFTIGRKEKVEEEKLGHKEKT